MHSCECKHKVVKYCVDCKTIYCKSCKREWYDACTQSHTPQWTYTYGNTTGGVSIKDHPFLPLIPENPIPDITWSNPATLTCHLH